MLISGSFALRYPHLIPCLLLCFRSPGRLERPLSSGRTTPHWLTGALDRISCTRKHLDLPSSQVTPMTACPGLRPRWCPDYSPYRIQNCCLPSSQQRRLSLPVSRKVSNDHNEQDFGAPYTACSLDPSGFGLPLPGLPADFTTDLLAKL
jgi:hypothetical protein